MKTAASLIAALAASVGEDVARAVVTKEVRRLGYGEELSHAEAADVLVAIEKGGGSAGLAARLARIRLDRSSGSVSSGSFVIPITFSIAKVAEMFTATLGPEKALEVVKSTVSDLGFSGDLLTIDQVSRVLDVLGNQSGVVSTVARFAKARLMLKTGG